VRRHDLAPAAGARPAERTPGQLSSRRNLGWTNELFGLPNFLAGTGEVHAAQAILLRHYRECRRGLNLFIARGRLSERIGLGSPRTHDGARP
jgi:hypothetical protein